MENQTMIIGILYTMRMVTRARRLSRTRTPQDKMRWRESAEAKWVRTWIRPSGQQVGTTELGREKESGCRRGVRSRRPKLSGLWLASWDVTGVSCPAHGCYEAYRSPEHISPGTFWAVGHLLSQPTPSLSSVLALLLLTYCALTSQLPGP